MSFQERDISSFGQKGQNEDSSQLKMAGSISPVFMDALMQKDDAQDEEMLTPPVQRRVIKVITRRAGVLIRVPISEFTQAVTELKKNIKRGEEPEIAV